MSKLAVCSGCRNRQLTSDTNKFCTNCGINVVDNGPAVAEVCSKTTCARGTSKWKFCATCGGKRPEAEISAVNAMFKVLAAPTQAGAQSSGNAIKTVAKGSDTVTSAGQTIAKERDSIGKATEAAGRDPSTSSKTAVERQPAAVARERTVEAVAGAPAKMQAEFGGIVRPSLASSEAAAGIAHLQSLTSAVERMTLYGTNVSRLDVSGAKQIRQSTKTAEAKSSDSGQSGSEQKQSASASDVQGRSFLINVDEQKTSLGIKPSVDGKRNLLEISPGKATGPREDLDSLAESGAQPNAQQQQQEQQVQQVQNQPQQQELQEQWPQELQQQQRRQQESQEQQQQMKQLQRQEKQAIGFHNRFVEEEYDDVHAGLEAAGQWNFNAFANDVENADYEDEYDDARGLVNVFGGFGGNMYGPAQMDNRMNFGRLGGRVDHFRRGPFGMGPLPQPKSCTFVFWVYVSSLFGKFEGFCIRYKLMWSPKTNKPSNVTYEVPLRALKDGLMEVQLPLATRDFHRMFTNDEASMELVSYHYYAKRSSKTVYEAKLDAANNDMWRSVRVSGRDFSNNSNNRVKMCDGVSIPPDWQPRTPEASEILQKELNTCFRRCLPRLSRTGRTEEKLWKSMTNFGADFSKVIEQFQRHYQRFSNEDEYNSVLNRHFSGQIEQVTMNIESEQIKRRDTFRMLEPGLLVLATFDAFRRKQQLLSVCSTIRSSVGDCCGLLLRFPSKEFSTVALDYTKNFRSSLGQYFVDERMYPANQQPTEPSFTEWRSCLTEMMYAFMNLPEETKVYTILLLPLYHALDDLFGAFEMAMTTSVGETDIGLRQKTQDWWGVGVLNNREDSFVSLRKCFAQAKMATLERMYELCRDALQVVPITSRIFVRFLSLEQLADFADVKFDRLSIESIVAALEWHFSDRSRSGSFNRFNRFNLALVHQALYKLCERLEPSSGEAAIERELASLKTDDNAMESWLRTQESTINLGQELLKGLLGAYFNEDEISKEWSKKKFSDDHFEALKACVKFVTCFAFTARRILDKRYGTHDGDFVEEIQLRRRTISEVMINIASAFSEVQAKVNGTLECMLPASFAAIDQKDDSSFDRRPLSFFASVFETMSIEQPCNELCDLLADAINTLDCQQRMALYCFTDPELSESAVTSASDKEQMKRLPEKIGQQINKNASDALSEAFEKVNVAVIESNRFAALVSEHFLSTMGQVIELDLIKDAQDTGVAASVKLKLIKGALKNKAVARMLEQMLCSEPLNGLLSEKALNCYQQLVRAFDTTQYSKLRDGEISLGAMELIDESAEQYVHLAGLCEKYLRPRSKMALSKLQECCDLRREEIGYYKKMKNMTMVFSGVLEQFTNSTLEKWRTKNREDDKSLAIKTLVMIRNDKREKLSTVNRYEMPSDDFIEEVLEPLSKLEQSYWQRYLISDVAIPQLLRSNGEEARRSSSMEVLRRDVLKFAIDQLRRIYEKVKDGGILAKSMIKLIAVAKWDSDLLEEEYRKLAKFFNDSDGWIEDRLVQTKAVLKTDRSRSVAAQLKEVQKRYGLRGDFSIVDRVLDKRATGKLPLKKFRHELWHDSLSKYDEDSPECEALRDFARENVKQLVNWLRKEVTTIRDFRVLIQLATDALGENAQDMMRVTMLSSAVNGYEALIYNVKEDHGFEELFGHCQSVFGRLQKDKDNRSLAKQLRDSASEMGWLKSLTSIRGSVETSTIQEFELVQNYGRFRVLFETKQLAGRPASVALGVSLLIDKEAAKKDVKQQYKDVQEDSSVQSSKTIALSRIKNASGEYSFDDIVDLTNRLMLISDNQTVNTGSDEGDNATRVGRATAKRQQFIQHFLTQFSQVTSLAEVSLELMSNQIQLFQELDCVFTCKASATDVSAESFELQLSKRLSEKFRIEFEQTAERTESVSLASECVRVLQVFFDYALNEWLGDLGKLREKYYELNHFTVKQLVLLRREMRKVDSEDRPDPRIYPILSAAFRCDVSEKAVVKAVQSMRKDYKEVKKQETEKNELGEAFKKKLQQLPIVMRDFNDVYGRWKQGQLDTSKPKSACELALGLNDLWLKYSDRVDSETEWLSLNQLSKVLSNLLLNSKINRVPIRRDVPVAIKKGAHNLAVCEEQNQLALLLSLYHEKNQKLARLPTREEVLLCNEKTTVEEIDLFWKRVTVPKPKYLAGDGLIYAIVGVHRLSYEVQSKAEVLMDIRKVAAEARGFAMVIICAREQENVCRMAITYGASRIDSDSFCKTTSEISAFVQGRLKLASVLSDNDKEQIKVPAAEIDAVKKGVEKSTVRFVRSDRAGVGKTLFIRRRTKDLRGLLLKSEEKEKYGCLSEDCENYETVAEIKQRQNFSDAINDRCRERQPLVVTLSLYKRAVDLDEALDALPVCSFTMADIIGVRQSDGVVQPCVYHIDIGHYVQENVDDLLFQLLIVGSVTSSDGFVWLKQKQDMYFVENLPIYRLTGKTPDDNTKCNGNERFLHSVLEFLPEQKCLSPEQTLQHLKTAYQSASTSTSTKLKEEDDELVVVDEDNYVLPYLHLREYTKARSNYYGIDKDLENFKLEKVVETHNDFLTTLLKTCGVEDPSWAELHNFCSFLDKQLGYCRNSAFYAMDSNKGSGVLPGFREFVVRFMIHMSRDFATRSLQIAEETPKAYAGKTLSDAELRDVNDGSVKTDLLNQYQMKRTWEASPHPYLFFNADKHSMTFLGFKLRLRNLHDPFELANAIDPYDQRRILMPNIMNTRLYKALENNHVKFNIEYDKLNKQEKIAVLANVIGMKKDSGSEAYYDPDPTYELTIDNMKKLLAIYMRLTCNIPVIIMGGTGCGKTRMVNYLCQLQVSHLLAKGLNVCNIVTKKIHGGVQESELFKIVEKAEKLAEDNAKNQAEVPYTVLFLDETNSSEIVHLIKELLCDRRLKAKTLSAHLKIICACNPYRKHSEAVIEKQRQAGLGYFKSESETRDVFGRMPMRHLVYRVQPLPKSLLPYVWDFGQLESDVEQLYIRQMVNRFVADEIIRYVDQDETREEFKYPLRRSVFGDADVSATDIDCLTNALCHVLHCCQKFMRQQTDECSFVSLRDVERTLKVFQWMLLANWKTEKSVNGKEQLGFFRSIDQKRQVSDASSDITYSNPLRAIILAVAACYHSSLQDKRTEFRTYLVKEALREAPLQIDQKTSTEERILQEIECCQDVFLQNCESHLGPNIARNRALKENIFMMIVCVDLRIPLFLVGKPGSSKSLAKSIVEHAMLGDKSKTPLFRVLKRAEFTAFQCSPHSTADGIISALRHCASSQLLEVKSGSQRDNLGILKKYVHVAVLEEIGLAEDSPQMPLKTLHSLLEDGVPLHDLSESVEALMGKLEEHCKIGFIGISNWALDPAKTNRGILMQRTSPSLEELTDIAYGICQHSSTSQSNSTGSMQKQSERQHDGQILAMLKPYIGQISQAYLKIYDLCCETKHKEFFGLRDFYALIQTLIHLAFDEVLHAASKSDGINSSRSCKLDWIHLRYAILRNFGGLPVEEISPLAIFESHLKEVCGEQIERLRSNRKDYSIDERLTRLIDTGAVSLIRRNLDKEALKLDGVLPSRSHLASIRYLLILTEDYASFCLLQQSVINSDAQLIFGSKFPKDQQYEQMCKDISSIRLAADAGKLCVLLNMDALHESLYDVLNQYYSYQGTTKFVDLSLGSHRIKCRVRDNFRIIIVASKEVAYKFPIPLLSRLEKHLFSAASLLSDQQTATTRVLREFCGKFLPGDLEGSSSQSVGLILPDIFVGFSNETLALIVHYVSQAKEDASLAQSVLLQQMKELLLDCATTDAILRLKTSSRFDASEAKQLAGIYWDEQGHRDLSSCLERFCKLEEDVFLQVTTFSQFLPNAAAKALNLSPESYAFQVYFLHAFDTILEFGKAVQSFMETARSDQKERKHVLIIQSVANQELVQCAQLKVSDVYSKPTSPTRNPFVVVFVVKVTRTRKPDAYFKGFQCGFWRCVHIDDLARKDDTRVVFNLRALYGKSISQLFSTDEKSDADNSLAIDKLLISLVPRAVPLLKYADDGYGFKRTKQLIRCLNLLVKGSLPSDLLAFFRNKIGSLFEQRHRFSRDGVDEEADEDWLHRKVASVEAICNYGTSAQSVVVYLQERTTPLFSALLAYCDTNRNLDSLAELEAPESPDSAWRNVRWKRISGSKLFEDSFKDVFELISARSTEMFIATGVNAPYFGHFASSARFAFANESPTCRLPFAFLMIKCIDSCIDASTTLQKNTLLKSFEKFQTRVRNLFGKELSNLLECSEPSKPETETGKVCKRIGAAYVKEFVCCKSASRSQDEFDFLSSVLRTTAECLMKEAKKSLGNPPMESDVLNLISALHFAFHSLCAKRLEHLQLLMQHSESIQACCRKVNIHLNVTLVKSYGLQLLDVVMFDVMALKNVLMEIVKILREVLELPDEKLLPINDSLLSLFDQLLKVALSIIDAAEKQRESLYEFFDLPLSSRDNYCERALVYCSNSVHALRLLVLYHNQISRRQPKRSTGLSMFWRLMDGLLLKRRTLTLQEVEKNLLGYLSDHTTFKLSGVRSCCKNNDRPCFLLCCENKHPFSLCLTCVDSNADRKCEEAECQDRASIVNLHDGWESKMLAVGRFFADLVAYVLSAASSGDERLLVFDEFSVEKLFPYAIFGASATAARPQLATLLSFFGRSKIDASFADATALQTFILYQLFYRARDDQKSKRSLKKCVSNHLKELAEVSQDDQFYYKCVSCCEEVEYSDSFKTGTRLIQRDMTYRVERVISVIKTFRGGSSEASDSLLDALRSIGRARFIVQELVDIVYAYANLQATGKQPLPTLRKSFKQQKMALREEMYFILMQYPSNYARRDADLLFRYFMRLFVRKYGARDLVTVAKDEAFSFLFDYAFPIFQIKPDSSSSREIDFFTLYGEEYCESRTIWREFLKDSSDEPKLPLSDKGNFVHFLTLLQLVTNRSNEANEDTLSGLEERLGKNLSEHSNYRTFIENIAPQLHRFLKETKLDGGSSWLVSLLIHFVVCAWWSNAHGEREASNPVRQLFRLGTHPQEMEKSFLPGIPSYRRTLQAAIRKWESESSEKSNPVVYQCRSGHVRVMDRGSGSLILSLCPDCGLPLSAYSLRPEDRKMLEKSDARPDHTHDRFGNPSENGLSHVQIAVLRLLTHLALLAGSLNIMKHSNSVFQSVLKMIGKSDLNSPSSDLLDYLSKDLEVLSRFQGIRNKGHIVLQIHRMLERLLRLIVPAEGANPPPSPSFEELSWSTEAGCAAWEKFFVENVVAPQLRKSVSLAELNDVEYRYEALVKYAFNDQLYQATESAPRPHANEKLLVRLMRKQVIWRVRQRVTIGDVERKLYEERSRQQKSNWMLLTQLFLSNYRVYEQLHRLSSLLDLFGELVPMVNRKCLPQGTLTLSMQKFLEEELDEQQRKAIESKIDELCYVWNTVRDQLMDYSYRGYSLKDTIDSGTQLSRASTVIHFLPSFQGRGLCTLLLITYLVDQHNFLLERRQRSVMNKEKINLKDVKKEDLINFNGEKDLLDMLALNASCSTDAESSDGPYHYNFADLEENIETNWLTNKPQIDFKYADALTNNEDPSPALPMFAYSDETSWGNFAKLNFHIPQKKLPGNLANEINSSSVTSRSLPQINEIIQSLKTAVNLLITIDCSPTDNLAATMAKIDMLFPFRDNAVLEKFCELQHITDLCLALFYLRATQHKQNKHDPFSSISKDYKASLTEKQQFVLSSVLKSKRIFLPPIMKYIFDTIIISQEKTVGYHIIGSGWYTRSLFQQKTILDLSGDEDSRSCLGTISIGQSVEAFNLAYELSTKDVNLIK